MVLQRVEKGKLNKRKNKRIEKGLEKLSSNKKNIVAVNGEERTQEL